MEYLILQLSVCLLVAAVIGVFIGWWLQGWRADRELSSARSSWQNRLNELKVQITEKNTALSTRSSDLYDRDEKIRSLQEELLAKDDVLKDLQAKVGELMGKLGDTEPGLKQEKGQVTSLRAHANSLCQDVSAKDAQRQKPRSQVDKLELALGGPDDTKRQIALGDNSSPSLRGQEFYEPALRDSLPKDDLKKIYGIGPVLEQALNTLGYHTFREIAAWAEADVEAVARELHSFPDRIRRDKWVTQAKSLHREKYGETP